MALERRAGLAAAAFAAICLAGCGSDPEPSGAESTTTADCSDAVDTTQVPVLVVEGEVLAGTTAEDAIASGSLVEKEIDMGYRPATAVVSLDDMAGGIAVADLAPNQIVVVEQWGLPRDVAVGDSPTALCPR